MPGFFENVYTLRPTKIFLSEIIWLFNLLVFDSIICYKSSNDDFRPFWVFLVNFTLLCNEFKNATKCLNIIVISLAERLELWALELFCANVRGSSPAISNNLLLFFYFCGELNFFGCHNWSMCTYFRKINGKKIPKWEIGKKKWNRSGVIRTSDPELWKITWPRKKIRF